PLCSYLFLLLFVPPPPPRPTLFPYTTLFRSTARKYPGQMLKGVRFTLTDRASYRPLATSLVIIDLIRRLHPDQFQWAGATLERHGGSARLRQAIEGGTLAELLREWERDQATFRK